MKINSKQESTYTLSKSKVLGFTLIELLAVIAIIGILAGIVLMNIEASRNKTADGIIKSNLAQIIIRAEVSLGYSGCYSSTSGSSSCENATYALGACRYGVTGTIFYDEKIEMNINEAGNASNGQGISRGTCAQATKGGAWAVSVPLKSNSNKSWCVDSNGSSKEINGAISGTSC